MATITKKEKARRKKGLAWYMAESGKFQIVLLQTIRAILAIGLTAVFCYRELSGSTVSDQFAIIVVMVLTMYFKDSSSAMIPTPDDEDEPHHVHGGDKKLPDPKEEKIENEEKTGSD